MYKNDGIFGYFTGDLLVNIDYNVPSNPLSEKLNIFTNRFQQYIIINRHSLQF
jgi:hypothetical protein